MGYVLWIHSLLATTRRHLVTDSSVSCLVGWQDWFSVVGRLLKLGIEFSTIMIQREVTTHL